MRVFREQNERLFSVSARIPNEVQGIHRNTADMTAQLGDIRIAVRNTDDRTKNIDWALTRGVQVRGL